MSGESILSRIRVARMVRKELIQLFRDPRTKRIIFVSPIIQLLIFGYAVNTDVRHVPTVVVDHDWTTESRLLTETLTATEYFRVSERSDRDGDARAALDRGSAEVALIIPRGYAGDLESGRGPAVQLLFDGSNSNTATVAQGYATRILTEYAQRKAAEGGAESRGTGTGPAAGAGSPGAGASSVSVPGISPAHQGIHLAPRAYFNPGLESRVYNVPGVIAVIVLLMCLLLTAMAVVREREAGTLDQLLVSPLTAGELMLGKTLPVAGVALVQMALVTAVALLWFRIPFVGSPAALLLAAGVYILAGLSFGLVLSTVSRTQQEAFLGLFMFFLPAIILSGFLYPVETMPPFFQAITWVNPLRHFLEIVRGVFVKGAGIRDLWLQYLLLGTMAWAGLVFATRRFKASVDGS